MLYDDSIVYICAPKKYHSGGPELLHQLGSLLISFGVNAFMYYGSLTDGEDPVDELYKWYKVPYTDNIIDSEHNYIIVPETMTQVLYEKNVGKLQKILWWLSVDNFLKFIEYKNYNWNGDKIDLPVGNFFSFSDKSIQVQHWVQSEYARLFLRKNGIPNEQIYYVSDYLNPVFIDKNISDKYDKKQDIVVFNPAKSDAFTQKLIENSGDIKWVPVQNLTPEQVERLLSISKVHVDFGNHPGKDRLPREAAVCGCCVITGRRGAAGNSVDIPIPEKYKFDDNVNNITTVVELIRDILHGYKKYIDDFASYREKIKNEQQGFSVDVKRALGIEELSLSNASDFISLAKSYEGKNRKQKLLCLYQAKFLASKLSDHQTLGIVHDKIDQLLSEGVFVPGTSIVILSYNTLDFTRQCLESIKNTISLDRCQVIVVDNASEDGSVDYLRGLDWITLVENHENRGFPGGCNDGIAASEPGNDIYLLNSDTILLPNSLFWLKMGLYESDHIGSCGSISNYAAGGQAVKKTFSSIDQMVAYADETNVPISKPYEYRMYLIGFSLLIKRTVLQEIGLLDERFNPGNSEDIDICLRILKAGRINLLCKNSFVIHFGSRSFDKLSKKGQDYGRLLRTNSRKLTKKLGFDPWDEFSKAGYRVAARISSIEEASPHILELGAGIGCTAAIVKSAVKDCVYTGIEEDEKKAAYAGAFGDIIIASWKELNPEQHFTPGSFDLILYPEGEYVAADKYRAYLKEDGIMLEKRTHPLLSISMLCNGAHREETLKCLRSLMTIRSRVDTELVIVDTGCDKSMRSLLDSYADRVVSFSWCDDFGKARNAGLKECSGDWFMYVDDDEWFENTDEIVSFFTSGRYRQYKQAAYIVRNYLDMDGVNYDDFWVGRMTRRSEKTHFIGKIHEYLSPLEGECAMLKSFEHHFGYVYKDKREHMAKARRNIRPLIEMIKEDPNNTHWYSQLVQEYIAAGEASSLSDFCDRVISSMDKADDPELNRIRADFYYGKLVASNELCDYDRTIADFNTFRKDRRNNEICMASLYFLAVNAYFQKKDYSHVISYGHRYIDIYDKWKSYTDLSERLNSYGSLTTKYVFSVRNLILLLGLVISSGLEKHETDDLFKYFDELKGLRSDGSQYEFVWGKTVDAFAESSYDQRMIEIADELLSYDPLAAAVSAKAREISAADKTGDKTRQLITVLGQTKNGRNYYLDYLRFLYVSEHGDDRQELFNRFKSLVLMTTDFFNLDPKLWQKADENSLDIGAVFSKVPLKRWMRVVGDYFDRHDEETTEPVREMMKRFDGDSDPRYVFYRLKLKETRVVHFSSDDGAESVLSDYSRDCISFYEGIYAREQFDQDISSSLLPNQAVFAVKYLKAKEADSIEGLRECIGIYEPFDNTLQKVIREAEEKLIKAVFLILKASDWDMIEPLWREAEADSKLSSVVMPVPYYDKNPDGTLGEYHYDRDKLPDETRSVYFADTNLSSLSPEVIFIFTQMDRDNPSVAVPAEYYADRLSGCTRMLIYVPMEVLAREGMAGRIITQVKQQLKSM